MKSVKGNSITNKVLSEESYRFSDSTPDETIYSKIGRNVGRFYRYWCDTCLWDKGYVSMYTDNFNYAKAHAHHIFQVIQGVMECFLDYTKMKCITFEELFEKTHIKDVISRETKEGFHNEVEPVFDGNYEKYLYEITPEIHIVSNFGTSSDFNCITFSPEEGVTCYYVVEPPSGPKENHPLVGQRKFMKYDRFNDDIRIDINSGYIRIERVDKSGGYSTLANAQIQAINCNDDLKEYFNLYTEKNSIFKDKFLQHEIYASIDKNAPVALLIQFNTHSEYVPGMGVFKKFLEKIIEEYAGYNIIIPDDFLYALSTRKSRTGRVSNLGYQDIVDGERDDRVLSRYGFREMSCGYVWLKKPQANSLNEAISFFRDSQSDESVYDEIGRNVGTLYFYWFNQTHRGADVELLVDNFKYAMRNSNTSQVQECFLDYVKVPCISLEVLYKEGLGKYLENLASQGMINEIPEVTNYKYEKFFLEAFVYIRTFCRNKFGKQYKCVTYNPFPGITGYCLLDSSSNLLSGIRKRYKVHDNIDCYIKKRIDGANHDFLTLQACTDQVRFGTHLLGQFEFRVARDFEGLKNEFKDSYLMGVHLYNSPFIKKEILKSVDKKASTLIFTSYHTLPSYPNHNGIFGKVVDYLIHEYGSECNIIFNDDFLYKNDGKMAQMKERDMDDNFFEKRGFNSLSCDYIWIRKPSGNSVNEVIGIGLDDIKKMVKESVGQIMNEAFSNDRLRDKYYEGYDLWYAYYLPNLKDAPNAAIYASQSYDYARKKSKEYSQSIYQLVIRRDTLNCIDFDAMNRIYCNGKMKVNEVPEYGTLQAMRDKFNAAVFTDEGVTNIFLFNAEHIIYDIDILKSPVSRDIDVWSERLTSDNTLITAVEKHKGQWDSLLGTMHLYDANIRFDDLILHHNGVFFKKEISRYLDSSKRTLMIDDVNIRVTGCGALTKMMDFIINTYSVCSLLVRIPDDVKDKSTLVSMRATTMTPEQLRKFFEKYGFEEIISHNGATWMIRK